MADLRVWEDRAKEVSVLVSESALSLVLRCPQCRLDPLASSTKTFGPRLTHAANQHNETSPGHTARVERKTP